MRSLKSICINEGTSAAEWCLWDYKEHGERIVLIWKGDGRDQSDVTEIDENGHDLMNVNFNEIVEYCNEHKNAPVDKWLLDISGAKIDNIAKIY